MVYVDLPMKTGILEAQQRIIQVDSDPRLQVEIDAIGDLKRKTAREALNTTHAY